MTTLIIVQILLSALTIGLLLFVFDIRARGWSRFDSHIPLIVASLLPLYGLGYMVSVFHYMESVTVFDATALMLMLLGLALVIGARIDLKRTYAWPGQFTEESELVRDGLYGHMRHPIYVGVGLFLIGTLFNVVVHSSFILGILLAALSAIIMGLLFSVARYEESHLRQKFGDVYVTYIYEVHAFIPFMKGQKNHDIFGSRNGSDEQ